MCSTPTKKLLCTPLLFAVAAFAGCGSGKLGTVTGTVTADGKPLANAMVTFSPEPAGRASSGLTNESGEYRLSYTRDEAGAVIGPHTVRISTAVSTDDEGDYGKTPRETLPAKYNVGSELKRDVKAGKNVFDFELDYEGRIIQPGY
jgi:hypothetical protein